MNNSEDAKKCLLCNKPYTYKYQMFGRGCLDNLYNFLEISKPLLIIGNKEMHLFNKIAQVNHKFFLSKQKKYILAQKYIALKYLEKMNLESLTDIIMGLKSDISSISIFSKKMLNSVSVTLNELYKLYSYVQKFNKLIDDIKNIKWQEIDDKTAETVINSFKFIFDLNKMNDPITYRVFYELQSLFWKVVVAGGIFTNKKLAARLLLNSLAPYGEKPNDVFIDDGYAIEKIKKDTAFKDRIKFLKLWAKW